jgi:hypothetical protein
MSFSCKSESEPLDQRVMLDGPQTSAEEEHSAW